MLAIVPSQLATTSFSIFIASRTAITVPFVTLAPTASLTSTIVPGMGALILTPPCAPAGAAGVAAFLGAGAAAGAATGAALPSVSSTVTS